jgi:hypothetical protein
MRGPKIGLVEISSEASMLQRQTIVQVAVAAVLCAASAIAQASPAGDRGRDDAARDANMMQWHAQMCTDRYARHVGEMAYLETKLALTDSQRPLFASWKDAVLAGAKSRTDHCLTRKRDEGQPVSLPDREARMHEMLEARLAEMDAQRPALTALYQSLTPEQKRVFDFSHGGHGGHGEHGHDRPGEHGPHAEQDG